MERRGKGEMEGEREQEEGMEGDTERGGRRGENRAIKEAGRKEGLGGKEAVVGDRGFRREGREERGGRERRHTLWESSKHEFLPPRIPSVSFGREH